MKIVLYQPEIPQNTGNIVRTCAVTGTDLILITPLGFRTSNRMLKRAGLDYWENVKVQQVDDLEKLIENHQGNFFFFSSKSKKLYTDVSYSQDDLLIFGSETGGLPDRFFNRWPDHFVKIPMRDSARCLNLASSAAIGLYEALRQQGFHLGYD